MSSLAALCPPVLSCAEARELEAKCLGGDESREWAAMQAAGNAVANGVLRDLLEIGGFPANGRILVLVGKGHNGGDALLAAHALITRSEAATVDVVFAFGERSLRPLTARAWRQLVQRGAKRVAVNTTSLIRAPSAAEAVAHSTGYDVCLDGVFGFQFRPPADANTTELIESVNSLSIRLRAAVDLPSAGLFRADFTYATGSVKQPIIESDVAGRIRYLDLGFFRDAGPEGDSAARDRIVTPAVLDQLRAFRPAKCDKRSYGHVFLLGGSKGFPGAILMSALAAVRSGAGLTTVFVPESLAAALAAQLPEAIWVGWPETPDGGLALEGEHLLRERIHRADALVIGPGMGREPETLALVAAIAKSSPVPLVLDADALQPDIVSAGEAARIITPHAGEFKRVAGDAALTEFAKQPNLTVVLKGPVTRVSDGGFIYHSISGGPVLARGGSGDLLSGMVGTQLAQTPGEPLTAAVRGVVWHGCAAESLARVRGQVAVRTTELLDHLGAVLREPLG